MPDLLGDPIPQSPYCNVRAVQRELATLVVGFDWEEREPTRQERQRLSQQIYEAGEMVRAVTIQEYGSLEDEVIDFGTIPIEEQQQMERPRPPEMILTMGYDDGWHRRWPREPKSSPMYERYMLEHAWGEERRRAQHLDTSTTICQSDGMSNYAVRGRVKA